MDKRQRYGFIVCNYWTYSTDSHLPPITGYKSSVNSRRRMQPWNIGLYSSQIVQAPANLNLKKKKYRDDRDCSVVAARQYKYDVVSCPSPQQLMKSRRDAAYSNCDSDFDCPGDDVCCSTGKAKVCSNTVSKYQVIRRKINILYF